MLTIVIPGDEYFDNEKQEFFTRDDVVLELEHSLAALSKWESIHEKPFLGSGEKSDEEAISYIKCMVVSPKTPGEIFHRLTQKNYEEINAYIDAKMTATWFTETPGTTKRSGEVITAELVYFWMISFNIPVEFEHWHLNRLFTLIRIANVKNGKPKKMSRSEIAARNRALNEQRRAQYNTSG